MNFMGFLIRRTLITSRRNWTIAKIEDSKTQYDGYRTKLLRNEQRVEETEYLTDGFSS